MNSKIIKILILLIICGSILLIWLLGCRTAPNVTDVYIDENKKVVIKYSYPFYKINTTTYCLSTNKSELANIEDIVWKKSDNNTCTFDIDYMPYYIYLKNNYDQIVGINETPLISKIYEVKLKKEKIYLPVGEEETIDFDLSALGNMTEKIEWQSSNSEIAQIQNGVLTAISPGKATIVLKIGDKSDSLDVIVTSTIVNRPTEFNYRKPYLRCKQYTSEEAQLIDEILAFKINEVGKSTRAATVEAARFITLNFPYRLQYFGENGRLTANGKYKVDGEGRYYHEGMYLSEDKYATIIKSRYGPKMWGCLLGAPYLKGEKAYNGFDCSGFVTWVLKNGGFDPGDIGAGVTGVKDLTDIGEKVTIGDESLQQLKVGDLLSGQFKSGGHIGIVTGINGEDIYVAESVKNGVELNKYNYQNLNKSWYSIILMDSYYLEDGKLTNMWY